MVYDSTRVESPYLPMMNRLMDAEHALREATARKAEVEAEILIHAMKSGHAHLFRLNRTALLREVR